MTQEGFPDRGAVLSIPTANGAVIGSGNQGGAVVGQGNVSYGVGMSSDRGSHRVPSVIPAL